MNHEERLARAICRALDESAERLDPWVVERLRAARERALLHAPVWASAEAPLVVAEKDGSARLGDGGSHPVRTAFLILAMILGMIASYYWNAFEQSDNAEEIDSALLADDIPPKAYLDPGFQAWLSHFVQSSAR